jgi:hypothetical protein
MPITLMAKIQRKLRRIKDRAKCRVFTLFARATATSCRAKFSYGDWQADVEEK